MLSNMTNLTSINGGNQTLINNPDLCTLETCDLSLSSLNYIPTLSGNALFLGIFSLILILQLGLGLCYQTWGFTIAMCLGLCLEVGGYVARVLMHIYPFNNNDFLVYLILLTIAPALLTAAIYLTLSRIVIAYGAELSRFKPRTYTLVFCTFDLLSLVLQGLGGGIAATAGSISGKNSGKDIMLVGLIWQIISLIIFALACGEFAIRVRKSRDSWNPKLLDLVNSALFKAFLYGLGIACLTIFTRCTFRVAELSGGFNGSIFLNDQIEFMVLEPTMISIACIAMTALHPGIAFQRRWNEANFTFRPFRAPMKVSKSSNSTPRNDVELSSGELQ